MRIYLAPLEGVTVSLYRNHYEKLYGNIDKYFAPFISPAEKCPLTPRDRKELLPENNSALYLVPQILCNNGEHFNECVDELQTLGYKEFNLNLGCPSGTVCAKKKGSGFLTIPDSLKTFLDEIYDHAAKTNIDISLKTRLGYTDPDEFYNLIDIFNEFPISELIIHPRIRTDQYKGVPRYEYYEYALKNAKCPLVYNGNIYSKDDYDRLCKRLDTKVDTVMIGRGAISNPNLANELRTGNTDIDFDTFWKFHDALYEDYKKIVSPDINILYKMKELWGMWQSVFDDKKAMKQIMKSKKCAEFDEILSKIR